MPAAFVTGGSGFVGGRLIERLVGDGWNVRGLARSDSAAAVVQSRGAEPVSGDLDDRHALAAGAQGADVTFHAAAHTADFGPWADFQRITVDGTRNVLRASREAGVKRFVHVGSEAALLHGQPVVLGDETLPLAFGSKAFYPRSKALAEQAVLEEGRDGFEVVVVRPRFVWGRGDTTLLPILVDAARSGQLRWVGGGRHLTSITHIDNTVEGLVLAAGKGRPGRVYFVTDGEHVVFREFVSALLETQGVKAPEGNMPVLAARALAAAGETAWKLLRLKGRPPLTRFAAWISSQECTLDDHRAREELGYTPIVTREQGLRELREATAAAARPIQP
jgi:nucleoside-diphosphate-sugar epimerase